MIGAVVNIAQGGPDADAWSATNGELYCIFMAITVTHGLINSLASRINARLQTVFVIANLTIILVTFIALPATTKHRNSASFVFGNVQNLSDGWPTGFGTNSPSLYDLTRTLNILSFSTKLLMPGMDNCLVNCKKDRNSG